MQFTLIHSKKRIVNFFKYTVHLKVPSVVFVIHFLVFFAKNIKNEIFSILTQTNNCIFLNLFSGAFCITESETEVKFFFQIYRIHVCGSKTRDSNFQKSKTSIPDLDSAVQKTPEKKSQKCNMPQRV